MKDITILGQKFNLKFVTKETLRTKCGENHDMYYGAMELVPRNIYINRDLTGEQLQRVLLHEMIHAYLGLAGLTEFMSSKLEEAICCALENQVDLFTNTKFNEFMTAKKPEEMK